MRCITIPPYSPQLNAAGKLITLIKEESKRIWKFANQLSLNTMKKIFDIITQESC